MKTYKIPVSWTVMATMEINAETLDDAISQAEDSPLPTETEYLDCTFEIDREIIPCINSELTVEEKAECNVIRV